MTDDQTCEDFILAWHDAVCPEGADCRTRVLHAVASPSARRIANALLSVLRRVVNEALESVAKLADEAVRDCQTTTDEDRIRRDCYSRAATWARTGKLNEPDRA